MDVQPTPPLELEEMDAKIIEFTNSHSETFNFDSEGLGEREKLRKYCMKVLDYSAFKNLCQNDIFGQRCF